MAGDDKLSRLESLPPELRSRVFRFAVVREEPYDLSTKESRALVVDPPLALTNRNVRKEAIPIFYGGNGFVIDTNSGQQDRPDIIYSWMQNRRDCIKFIKHVAAFNRNRPIRLSVSIGNHKELKVRFENIRRSESKCICNIEGGGQGLFREPGDDSFPGEMLLCCWRDLVGVITHEIMRSSCQLCEGTPGVRSYFKMSLDEVWKVVIVGDDSPK